MKIQVVGGLIEQEDIRLNKEGEGEGDTHPPAS